MTEDNGLGLIQYDDFNQICRLCCKSSDNLIHMYQNFEESSNNSWSNIIVESETIVVMLLNIGLNVIIRFTVHMQLNDQLRNNFIH